MPYQPKPLQWFLDRIGKRIYRDDNGCPCNFCREALEKGIIIEHRDHAVVMSEMDVEFANNGIFLNYRDGK